MLKFTPFSISILFLLIITHYFTLANTHQCEDRENNVISIEYMGKKSPIQLQNGTIGTYSMNGKPSCYNGTANVVLPGKIKLLGGAVTVSLPLNLVGNSRLLLTLESEEPLIGKICENGKSREPHILPNKFCSIDLCARHALTSACKMLEKPGNYTIEDLGPDHSTVSLPSIPPIIPKAFIRGQWRAEGTLVYGPTKNEQVAIRIRVPADGGWFNLLD